MSFQDIKGHDNVILFLKRELKSKGKGARSYLFFGPEGVGKTLMATTLAKALSCLNMDSDCCDNCPSCAKIENRIHPDVMWVEDGVTQGSIGIDAIREIQKRVSLRPYEGRTKVFIIQQSHLMTQDAANCLLKTLEEPPGDSVIILITSKIGELLPTVRSRCKQIRFEPLGLELRLGLLKKIKREEALFLSRLASNGAYLSSRLEGENIFDYKNSIVNEFCSEKELLDEKSPIFSESKEGMKFAISILESWFRDILVLKSASDASLVINLDRIEELKQISTKFSFEELENIFEEIDNAYFYIDRNVGPKLVLNSLKIKLAEMKGQYD